MWGQSPTLTLSLTLSPSLSLSLSLCVSLSLSSTHYEQVAPPAADGRAARGLAESEQRVREETNLLCRPAETASASGCQRDSCLFLNAPSL
jgi:hypothetical protein